ncbi:putative oxalate decarboxylase oxdC [Amylocarpus encephaloides]|uniref:Oxalate decarboxylase oxdC n=1 Tax=Amylocarpus encephaloides TaxID=45428 RepID=A0A9P8C7W2_9HELO|nr:putative oxalate decarboxylase oxdC [Amylocarpus encephaloides]
MKIPAVLAVTLYVALASATGQERRNKHLRPVLERRAEAPLQPIVGTKGSEILVPENHAIDDQNPNSLKPPTTDGGLLGNLKWSFSHSMMKLQEGGFVREQVVTDLPSSEDFSAAQNHLKKGAIRQMHWHDINEWGIVTVGSVLVGAVDHQGKNQVFRADKGDIWFFPKGEGHVIQGLSDAGAEYLLVFDNGDFDAKGRTLNVADWVVHTPLSVLAKNFGVSQDVFKTVPKSVGSIIQGGVSDSSMSILSPNGKLEGNSSYHFQASKVPYTNAPGGGGRYLIVDSKNFPITSTLAAQLVEVKPGAMRELHWHPNGAEWLYFQSGHARATVWVGGGNARTFDFQEGDTAVFPDNAGHYVENTHPNETLYYIEIFKAPKVLDFSLQQWLALTPPDIVAQILNVSVETVKSFKTNKQVIIAGNV